MRSLFAPALLCALLTSQPGLGAIVTDYGYPFADPLVATVIGTPEEFQADLPVDIPLQTRELALLGRQVPDASRITPPLRHPESRPGHDIALRVRADLGAILGSRVDLVPAPDLKPEVRARVERGLVSL